ncbi:MAG: hypothetical protein H7321_02945, partial [Bacteroidia bacterium]|nr:hypothetical protein [Bacteroidia bacterium]
LVFNDSDFYLLDASDFSSFSLPVNIPSDLQYDKVKFNVGVDSLTNVSGAMGGNLDPAKGMYWTWQSGYINCKIEGTCSNCQTRNNEFQLHLGGYSEPFNCLQRMEFQHNPNSKNIQLELDLKKFIETSYLSVHPNVMSPNVEAVRLSALFKSCFSISKQ